MTPPLAAPHRSTPVAPEIGIIAMVWEPWSQIWRGRHQLLTRLARYFNVVWAEPPRHWRSNWSPRAQGLLAELQVPDIPGFQVYRPGRLLPEIYRPPVLSRQLRATRLRRAARMLRRAGAERMVLYLWRPEFAWSLDVLPHAASFYHIDDEYTYSTADAPVDSAEAELIRRVDQVFIHSQGLWEKKARFAIDPAFTPNGVDFDAFATTVSEPEDLRNVPHPRVGYVGVVRRFLDIPLMLQLAKRHPQLSFVVVGPARALGEDAADFEAMCRLPNVFWLGARPVGQLPSYMQHMDVAIMPYDNDGYTKYINPLKLYEYLATGLPTIGTPIPTLRAFDGPITLASGVDEWTAALHAAVAPTARTDQAIAARQQVAREHDWRVLAHRIALKVAMRVDASVAERVIAAGPQV